jgi:Ca2+-binding RTX toxin-like protein
MRHTWRPAWAVLAVVAVGTMASAAGSAPANVIYGSDGSDVIAATPAADVIYAKSGNDTISGVGTGDVVYAGSGNDTIAFEAGEANSATIDANVGDDLVVGGTRVDDSFVNLGSGADYLLLDGCRNHALGGSGADVYENHAGCAAADPGTLDLGNGDDSAWVRHSIRAVLGNGNDMFTTHSPRVVHAGSGNDIVRFEGGGAASVYLAAGNDRLLLNGASGVTAYGNSGQDEVSGSFADSVIRTESGEDTIELLSASAANQLFGGGNHDLARLAPASSGTTCASLERVVDLDGNPRACS